jgi:hypothetical protein
MSCRPRYPRFNLQSPGFPNIRFWWVKLCIRGLLSKGGPEGPFLDEVPLHKKLKIKKLKKKRCLVNHVVFGFKNEEFDLA